MQLKLCKIIHEHSSTNILQHNTQLIYSFLQDDSDKLQQQTPISQYNTYLLPHKRIVIGNLLRTILIELDGENSNFNELFIQSVPKIF